MNEIVDDFFGALREIAQQLQQNNAEGKSDTTDAAEAQADG